MSQYLVLFSLIIDSIIICRYGTEQIIDVKHFMNMELVSKNVMLYALKYKKDIYGILSEIEDMMKKDLRMNPKPDPYNGISARRTTILLPGETIDLTLRREFYDNIPVYLVSYGCLVIRATLANDYLLKGAYLLEEKEGKVRDLVERLIRTNPEWKKK